MAAKAPFFRRARSTSAAQGLPVAWAAMDLHALAWAAPCMMLLSSGTIWCRQRGGAAEGPRKFPKRKKTKHGWVSSGEVLFTGGSFPAVDQSGRNKRLPSEAPGLGREKRGKKK